MKTIYELAVINVRKHDPHAMDTRVESGDDRFRDSLKKAMWEIYADRPDEYDGQHERYFSEIWEEMFKPKFIPDLWRIDSDRRKIYLYEIEDTHPLSNEKLSKLHDYWWDLDAEGWLLYLTVFDRYGLNPREIDLTEFAFGMIPVMERKRKTG